MPQVWFSTLLLIGLAGVGIFHLRRNSKRRAVDVMDDLAPAEDGQPEVARPKHLNSRPVTDTSDKYKLSAQSRALTPILVAISFVSLRLIFASPSIGSLIFVAGMGLAVGVIINSARERSIKAKYQRDIEFYLPVVMERIVMAVQAGLDILAALRAVFDLERVDSSGKLQALEKAELDPVTALLRRAYFLTESGMGFEESLNDVAREVDSSPLRHAFIHLAMAHKEGGELVMPLKELSDSTQLYFQESVEEEIAKMPVKATMPLLCTFAGLIICFITSPLIQVIEMTAKATPK